MAASARQDSVCQVMTDVWLARVVQHWDALPEPMKAAIVTIVESVYTQATDCRRG